MTGFPTVGHPGGVCQRRVVIVQMQRLDGQVDGNINLLEHTGQAEILTGCFDMAKVVLI